jgi:hypothetical protein
VEEIPPRQALLAIGAEILRHLSDSKTVSCLWDEYRGMNAQGRAVPFAWFVLTLDLLFLLGAIELEEVRIRRTLPKASRSEEIRD